MYTNIFKCANILTKDKINKRIKENEIEQYLKFGWTKGMFNPKYNK